jgi:hypothetical protein
MAPALNDIPFSFEIPVDVWRKSSADPDKEWRIGGIISSEHKDRHGEVVLQRGLEFQDFLKSGWINDNHAQGTTDVLGYPLRVQRTTWQGKPATYMEGYLLKDYKPARKVMELAESLQKTNRRLGFSVEGKIQRRAGADGKVIAKARVTNVAVTNCPVNTATGLEVLAKSMMDIEGETPCFGTEECCGKCDIEKALTAGSAISAPTTPVPGDGFALRTESLEGGPKDDRSGGSGKKKKKKKRRLSKAEGLKLIRGRFPLLSEAGANRIWQFAITQQRRV